MSGHRKNRICWREIVITNRKGKVIYRSKIGVASEENIARLFRKANPEKRDFAGGRACPPHQVVRHSEGLYGWRESGAKADALRMKIGEAPESGDMSAGFSPIDEDDLLISGSEAGAGGWHEYAIYDFAGRVLRNGHISRIRARAVSMLFHKASDSFAGIGCETCKINQWEYVFAKRDGTIYMKMRINPQEAELKHPDPRAGYRAFSRACHDCGRPTNDYRCEDCRRKFMIKHHVDPELVFEIARKCVMEKTNV